MPENPLHDARVQRGIPLASIACITRLSPHIVDALDSGQFSTLPAGIYARAYVRAFAAAVGLEGDRALATLEGQLPVAAELSPAILEQLQPRPRIGASGTMIARNVVIDVAFLVGVTALLVS